MDPEDISGSRDHPLALALLQREHDEIERAFERVENASGPQREHARALLLEAIDRHLALEEAVFYPALERTEGLAPMRRRSEQEHDELRAALAPLREDGKAEADALHSARLVFHRHRRGEEEEVFPLVQRKLGELLPELALELEQQREAEKGAYGVG